MRRRSGVTDKMIERRLRQGYGQGDGALYKPAMDVRDVPSVGEGWQTPVLLHPERGTPHQFMSRLEMTTACIYERLGATQIREQYALLCDGGTRDETTYIADLLGVKHPMIPGTLTRAVMTTDILADMPDGSRVAVYCKPKALLDPTTRKGVRNLEKQAIEAIYWSRRPSTTFVVVTEEDYPEVFKDNVVDLRGRLFHHEHAAVRGRVGEAAERFLAIWEPGRTLIDLIRQLVAAMTLSIDQVTHLVYLAVWATAIPVDLKADRFHPSNRVILE